MNEVSTIMASLRMSQSGRWHCCIEKGVLLDLCTTPRLSMCIVVDTGEFAGCGNALSRAQRVFRAPMYP